MLTALIGTDAADADVHLGSAVQPAGSRPGFCAPNPPENGVFVQATSDAGGAFTVPAGGGQITQWELSTVDALPSATITLVVLRPATEGTQVVVTTDTETLPNPLPADEVASFAPASPITVAGGEVLGLYAPRPEVSCFFRGGATPEADTLGALVAPAAPAPGQTLSPFPENSGPGYRLNLAATLRKDQNVAVTATSSPANATVGALAVLNSTIINRGPGVGPVDFTDTVPSGLTVGAAVAGSGTCTTAGQAISCVIGGLAVGQSAPVSILVTPTVAGSYLNTVSVTPRDGLTDPMPADNSAAARLDVVDAPPPAPSPTCIVPNLRHVPHEAAKHLLRRLDCKPGKVRHTHSRRIAKGAVIRTSPKPGTYPTGRRVGLVVSSGSSRHHRHHDHHHRRHGSHAA